MQVTSLCVVTVYSPLNREALATAAGWICGHQTTGSLVGLARFELTTSCSQSKRSARLNYNPINVEGYFYAKKPYRSTKSGHIVLCLTNKGLCQKPDTPFGVPPRQILGAGCVGWTCTTVLLGMSQASCYCSTTPSYELTL